MLFARSMSRFVIAAVLLVFVGSSHAASSSVEDVIDVMASRLERSQVEDGTDDGLWESEPMFTGAIAAGLACAFECTENTVYKLTCNSAGWCIMKMADIQGNLLGDEAYAFVCLSEIANIPQGPIWGSDYWRDALVEFYGSTRKPGYEESTEAYLLYFDDMEPSTAVYSLAHHVLAAYYVDDVDKEVWRQGLIRHLSRLDDTAGFPVMALGAATWALAATDGLDDVPVASEGGSAYWEGLLLSDLPALLLSHQVPEGEAFAGSFYWRFDHSSVVDGGIAVGFTEDAVYGTLGLVAVAGASDDPASEDMVRAITAAQEILLQGVDAEGGVYQHLALVGETYHVYAGEMLQALWSTEQYLDSLTEMDSDETEGASSTVGDG